MTDTFVLALEDATQAPLETGTPAYPARHRLSRVIEAVRALAEERGWHFVPSYHAMLARGAATSRQQLWRVMTGKSELTGTLGQRLAEILQVDARALRTNDLAGAIVYPEYLTDDSRLTLANTAGATLGSLAAGFALLPWLGVERGVFVIA